MHTPKEAVKNKWNIRSPSVDKECLEQFAADGAWTNDMRYRTSYRDMSEKVSKVFI